MTRKPLLPLLSCVLPVALLGCGSSPSPSAPPAPPAPALVQVENDPASRPHAGLQKADMVFEYLTEGGITRFTAVYMAPSGATRVGPVRSARLVTLRIQRAYGGVLFYSGASNAVLGKIRADKMTAYDENSDGGRYFSRDSRRQAPHNLFTTAQKMADGVARSGRRATSPKPGSGEAGGAEAAAQISFDQTPSHSVTYRYAADTRSYGYSTETGPEVDAEAGGAPLRITNVVLVRVPHHGAGYTEDVRGAEGIDFDLTGSGAADVYTGGKHLLAQWNLAQPDQPLKLTVQGRDLLLPAGLTWIHLVDPDTKITAA